MLSDACMVYVRSSAITDGKASYIARQRSGLHYAVTRPSDVKVRVFGRLAIITGRGDYEVTQNGQDTSLHLLFTAVWAKRGPNVQFVSWNPRPFPSHQGRDPARIGTVAGNKTCGVAVCRSIDHGRA